MPSRRTHARISFLAQLVGLYRLLDRRRADEVPPMQKRWFLTGVAYGVGLIWARDRDVCGVRTSWRRRGLLSTVVFGLGLGAGLRSSNSTVSDFALGASLGRLGYRFWYGVVRPLPASDG